MRKSKKHSFFSSSKKRANVKFRLKKCGLHDCLIRNQCVQGVLFGANGVCSKITIDDAVHSLEMQV